MICINPIEITPKEDEIFGQEFNGGFVNHNINTPSNCIRVPLVTRYDTFKKYTPYFREYGNKIRALTGYWQSEMDALCHALKTCDIKVIDLPTLGVCNDWNIEETKMYNYLHYCQPIDGIFHKQEYYKNVIHIDIPENLSRLNKELIENLNYYK